MVNRRMNRRRRPKRKSRAQLFRENGATAIKAQQSYSVGADGLEVPADRSFKAKTISLHLVSNGPMLVQVELWAPVNRAVWRSAPISVGLIPVRRTYRWPTSAAAMWPSTSSDTIFKIVCPCPGKTFNDNTVSVSYTVTVQLSADYDQQICPKQHGIIQPLVPQQLSIPQQAPAPVSESDEVLGFEHLSIKPVQNLGLDIPTLSSESRSSTTTLEDSDPNHQTLASESSALK